MSIETLNSAQEELPACPICGSHGQLIDLHEKAKRLGDVRGQPFIINFVSLFRYPGSRLTQVFMAFRA